MGVCGIHPKLQAWLFYPKESHPFCLPGHSTMRENSSPAQQLPARSLEFRLGLTFFLSFFEVLQISFSSALTEFSTGRRILPHPAWKSSFVRKGFTGNSSSFPPLDGKLGLEFGSSLKAPPEINQSIIINWTWNSCGF